MVSRPVSLGVKPHLGEQEFISFVVYMAVFATIFEHVNELSDS
jgi:hypothetical protein